MKLSEWFVQSGRKKGDFAADIGVTPQMISAYCKGQIWPSKATMQDIITRTGGAVTADDFVWLNAEKNEDAA